MKKLILSLLCFMAIFAIQAQTNRTLTKMTDGSYQSYNTTYADTIESGETLNFIIPVAHYDNLNVVIDQRMKVVAADTTVVLTIYESMDGTTWHRVQYNNSGSQGDLAAYTLAKGATAVSYVTDVTGARLRMRYIKLAYVAPTKTGFKKIIYGYIKLNR